METISKVEKEDIPLLNLVKTEVLLSDFDRVRRKKNLEKARILGNSEKSKVKLIFELESGEKKMVETTLWAVGQDFVSLKAGTLIPIHTIHEVEF